MIDLIRMNRNLIRLIIRMMVHCMSLTVIPSAVFVEELLDFWLKLCIHGALLFLLAAISVCFVVAAVSALPLQILCTFHRKHPSLSCT